MPSPDLKGNWLFHNDLIPNTVISEPAPWNLEPETLITRITPQLPNLNNLNNVTVPSDVTISGSASDVWIFQIAGNLTMSAAMNVTLSGGAQAKNIFWQVAGQVTLGTTSHLEGIVLCKTNITLQTGASLNGRALAQTSVILDKNAVTQP